MQNRSPRSYGTGAKRSTNRVSTSHIPLAGFLQPFPRVLVGMFSSLRFQNGSAASTLPKCGKCYLPSEWFPFVWQCGVVYRKYYLQRQALFTVNVWESNREIARKRDRATPGPRKVYWSTSQARTEKYLQHFLRSAACALLPLRC